MFLAASAWVFLLVSLGSFHYDGLAEPRSCIPIRRCRICAAASGRSSRITLSGDRPGRFPALFFTGVCLVLVMCQNRVGDLWMRTIGADAADRRLCGGRASLSSPGSYDGFPEGRGGIVGIGTATFLQHYFSTVGTRLILLTTALVGLLLAADDLVLRTPGVVAARFVTVKDRAPQINWNFVPLPRLPALPRFVTRDATGDRTRRKPRPRPGRRSLDEAEDAALNSQPAVILKRDKADEDDKNGKAARPDRSAVTGTWWSRDAV